MKVEIPTDFQKFTVGAEVFGSFWWNTLERSKGIIIKPPELDGHRAWAIHVQHHLDKARVHFALCEDVKLLSEMEKCTACDGHGLVNGAYSHINEGFEECLYCENGYKDKPKTKCSGAMRDRTMLHQYTCQRCEWSGLMSGIIRIEAAHCPGCGYSSVLV